MLIPEVLVRMRITMLSVGSTGDVRPYVLLGQELQARGHRVTISAFPRFEGMVTDAGLAFYPIRGSAESMMASIMEPDTSAFTYLPRLWKGVKDAAPQMLKDMTDSCKDADAMVCNFFGSVFYSISEKYNIPCIQTHLFPMDPTGEVPISSVRNQHLGSLINKGTYKVGYYTIGTLEKHILGPWRQENGLTERKPATRPVYRVGEHEIPVICAISPSFFPRPADWDPRIHMSGFWFDETPNDYQPSPDLREFLENGKKPIYIGFGSMNTGDMDKLLFICLRSVHAAGLRAVFSTGWGDRTQLKSTNTVFFLGDVPHDWLFPRVSAVVHHGGAGTTAAGLRYGRPSLIIPFAGDQAFWAHQVYRSGSGPKPIPRDSLSIKKMTRALLDLTENTGYAESAQHVSKGMAEEHGVRSAADWIEKEVTRW